MEWLFFKGIPIEAQYLYRKALEMENQGKIEIALKYFRQTVMIAPNYVKAFHEMGNCFALLGRYDEAIIKYDQAIHIDPLATEPRVKKDLILNKNHKA